MSLFSFYRISKPSEEKVPADKVMPTYKSLRRKTFWGVTAAYSLYFPPGYLNGVVFIWL